MKKTILLLLFLFIVVDTLNAQNFYSKRRDRNWMLSFGAGGSAYQGDLYDIVYDGFLLSPNFGLGLRKKIGSQLSLRVDLNWYQIGGADSLNQKIGERESVSGGSDSRRKRNLSFKAKNLEASAVFLFNFIPVNNSYTSRAIINPYIFAGVGITTNEPQALYENEWHSLRPLQTELTPYSGRLMVVPVGIGVRLKATKNIDILFEAGRRFTFSDYLDDISKDHVDRDQFDVLFGENTEMSQLAKALSDRSAEGGFSPSLVGDDRGNPGKNDTYYIFQIRLEMYLPGNAIQRLFSPTRRKPKFR